MEAVKGDRKEFHIQKIMALPGEFQQILASFLEEVGTFSQIPSLDELTYVRAIITEH